MRISDWSSDVCSSDLVDGPHRDPGRRTRRSRSVRPDMHAVTINLTIDPVQAPAAAATFSSDILPKVAAAPGFQGGYWMEPVAGEGFGIFLFDDADHTRPLTADDFWQAPGVQIRSIDVRSVAVAI